MDIDFGNTFKIPTRALNLSKAHPFIKRDKKWVLRFAIVHGIFTLDFLIIFYNIVCHDLKINNFSQTCKNGILSVVYMVVSFQFTVLVYHQHSLAELMNNMNRDYEQSNNLSVEERAVMHKYANQGIWVCKQWLVVISSTCGIFVAKNITLMVYYYCTDEFKLVPFYDLVYPPIIEDKKDNIYMYLVTYMSMFIYDCYAGVMYLAYVPLGPIFILHACGQLELVEKRIDDLFVDCDDQVIRRKLKSIIVQLQYIYSFVDRIKDVFRIAYELTLKATTIILPITVYEVLETLNRGEVSLEFITFIIGGTLISSSPCYYSNLLMEKGENVRLSLYTCGWELYYDRRTRTTLQLMLQYALRPIAIRTVFRTLCLDALTDLFQQSYGIFNLMNAMWN